MAKKKKTLDLPVKPTQEQEPNNTVSNKPSTELEQDSKIVETNKNAVQNTSKKPPFQRLFSEEDEIVILNGIIEFEAKNKMSPSADMDAFLEFVKTNGLHVDVSKRQLQEKIRKMKIRYDNNKGNKSFANPQVLDLSDKIWGGVVANVVKHDANVVSNVKRVKRKNAMVSNDDLSIEEKIFRMGMEMFEGENKNAGWKEWKKLQREDMELTVKQFDVKRAKMRLVLANMGVVVEE